MHYSEASIGVSALEEMVIINNHNTHVNTLCITAKHLFKMRALLDFSQLENCNSVEKMREHTFGKEGSNSAITAFIFKVFIDFTGI